MVTLFYSNPTFGKDANESLEDPILMEGITVTAPPIEEEAEQMGSAYLTVIEGEDLEGRFSSIPEVLSVTVGVKINRFGGLGDFSAISIRGSSSEQVLVYLDGFLLNSAQGGAVNLARIPLSQIEAIEIYRGSAPILFGKAGIGGLVQIRTKAAGRKRALSYQVQYGSFNTSRINASYAHKPGKIDFLIGLNHEKSGNDFEFLDDSGTQFNPADDRIVKRKNSRFESLNLITKIAYDFSKKGRLSFHYHFLKTDKGVPGLAPFQSEHANFKTETHRTNFSVDLPKSFQSKLDVTLGLFYDAISEAFKDPLGEIGTGNQDNENNTDTYETRLNIERKLGNHQTLKGLLQYRHERFSPFDRLLSAEISTSKRKTRSIGIEDEIALFRKKLILTPSLLYDHIENRFQGDTFLTSIGQPTPKNKKGDFLSRQIGLRLRLSNSLTLRANIGRYSRPPNFFELFGDRGGTIGNAELIPEEGLNSDIGLEFQKTYNGIIRHVSFQAVYFHNRVDESILFVQSSQKTSKAQNIGRAETAGQELVGKIAFGAHFKLDANYTHQRAVNKSGIPSQHGKILPGRPVHELSAKLTWDTNRTALFYSYDFMDENYLDRANQRLTHSRQIHNVGISIKAKSQWSLTIEAKNLSDDRIEDIFGFPLPGRAYFMTLQGRI